METEKLRKDNEYAPFRNPFTGKNGFFMASGMGLCRVSSPGYVFGRKKMKKVILIAAAVMILLAPSSHLYSAEEDPVKKALLELSPVRLQFFCGYCHILTYPKIIKKAHDSWKTDKHKDVSCKECHFPPEEINIKIPEHERIPREEKAAQKNMESAIGDKGEMDRKGAELEVASRLLTVLNMDESVVRTKPRIDDGSCTTSKCHGSEENKFMSKEIKFTEKISFVHKPHFDEKKLVEGHGMHCTTCHQRETEQKHFEVSREKCFLCHFKNAKFNEERSKCSLCHEIPTRPLQKQKKEDAKPDEKPITHKSLEEAKVPCQSCHSQLVKGNGFITKEKCLTCHDNEKDIMKEAENKKLMHKEHVAGQNAHCFNCHEPIEHKQAEFMDIARSNCQACHPDHHKYQKMLLTGIKRKGVPEMPSLMFSVKTNCLACHTDERLKKGEKIAHGSGKACAACHTEKHEEMAKEWKDKTAEELNNAKEIEKEAMDAIENAKGKVSAEKLKEAMAIVKAGQENMYIVEYGGGVHNKKYSVILLDNAMNNFEDAIDLLGEEE